MNLFILDPGQADIIQPSGICYVSAGDLWANPYDATDPFHLSVGSSASFAGAGHAETIAWNSIRGCAINSSPGAGGGCVTHKSVSSQTPTTITWDGSGGVCDLPQTVKIPPDWNTGPNGTNQLAVVFDPEQNLWREFYGLRKVSGLWKAHSGWKRAANGLGYDNGNYNRGVTASGISIVLTLIRAAQWNGHICQQALGISLDPTCLGSTYVYPGSTTDGGSSGNGVLYGRRLSVPSPTAGGPSPSLFGSTGSFLRNMYDWAVNYGLHVVGQGSNNVMIAADDISSTIRNSFSDGMYALWPYFKPILNFTNAQTCVGGGTPLAPNCAYNSGVARG